MASSAGDQVNLISTGDVLSVAQVRTGAVEAVDLVARKASYPQNARCRLATQAVCNDAWRLSAWPNCLSCLRLTPTRLAKGEGVAFVVSIQARPGETLMVTTRKQPCRCADARKALQLAGPNLPRCRWPNGL